MKRIKTFYRFDESIQSLSGFDKIYKKYNRISEEDIEDRLLEITDLGLKIIKIDKIIQNERGFNIQTFSDPDGKYFFSYYITLNYPIDKEEKHYTLDNFDKRISKINLVNSTISSVIRNICKIFRLELINTNVSILDDRYYYYIGLGSQQIPQSEIKELLGEYQSTIEGKCKAALGRISKYLSDSYGVEDAPLDFNWDMIDSYDETGDNGNDYIPCGFFTDDEIIIVAHYLPERDFIDYDEDEIQRAIEQNTDN